MSSYLSPRFPTMLVVWATSAPICMTFMRTSSPSKGCTRGAEDETRCTSSMVLAWHPLAPHQPHGRRQRLELLQCENTDRAISTDLDDAIGQ
jgi:hypothetical protein